MADIADCRVIVFDPKHWGTFERFQHFYFNTYPFGRYMQSVVSGAASHFHKALYLEAIAKEFSPKLVEDKQELEDYGHTSARRSNELSALIEAAILELYSSLDCTRKVISEIYKSHRGVKDSTRKLFQAMFDNKVAESVPSDIRNAFQEAYSWYPEFLKIRDVLTHSDTGSCSLGDDGKIRYMNFATGDGKRSFIKEDIFQYLETLQGHVNRFIGRTFAYLNMTLRDEEVRQVCGFFGGLIYTRRVKPNEAIDFNSGRCINWFDSPGKPRCPLADKCGAYRNPCADSNAT
jgi:hypothetical protein